MSIKATIAARQSLLDIAIQERGTLDALLQLSLANDVSVTDDIEAGTALEVDVEAKNIEIESYFKAKELKPATALSAEDEFNANPEGIDYMIIETDFIVQ